MATIMAISGSLRATSFNTTILNVVGRLLPAGVQYRIFDGIGDLPHFNPDIDKDDPIPAVQRFRDEVKRAAAVVICTPEYAFGVPGVLKNALDWLVSSGELNEKPVGSISASPMYRGGDRAHASLLLTLEALGTKRVAQVSMPAVTTKFDAQGELTDSETLQQLTGFADALATAIQETE